MFLPTKSKQQTGTCIRLLHSIAASDLNDVLFTRGAGGHRVLSRVVSGALGRGLSRKHFKQIKPSTRERESIPVHEQYPLQKARASAFAVAPTTECLLRMFDDGYLLIYSTLILTG